MIIERPKFADADGITARDSPAAKRALHGREQLLQRDRFSRKSIAPMALPPLPCRWCRDPDIHDHWHGELAPGCPFLQEVIPSASGIQYIEQPRSGVWRTQRARRGGILRASCTECPSSERISEITAPGFRLRRQRPVSVPWSIKPQAEAKSAPPRRDPLLSPGGFYPTVP